MTQKAGPSKPNAVILEEKALDRVSAGGGEIAVPLPGDEAALKKLPGKRTPPTVTLKRGSTLP